MNAETYPRVLNQVAEWLENDTIVYLNECWYATKTRYGFQVVKAKSEKEAWEKITH